MSASQLRDGLLRFQRNVNDHPQMRKVLNDWDRDILVEASDAPERYLLLVRDRRMDEVTTGDPSGIDIISIKAPLETLMEIFCGFLSPAQAHDEGVLQVFASERDQVKLDTISLLLWGL